MSDLRVTPTSIPGLYSIDIVVHPDDRGSFREAYQAAKMEALGLPRLGPVQWNISENVRAGIVRGIHAEPWDKYIHVLRGEVFAAIVDMRPESSTFGRHETFTLSTSRALFVSQGLGNSYQVTSDGALYGYLVNAHWQPGLTYPAVHYADPTLNIAWPLPVGPGDVSAKDAANPTWLEVFPARR